MLNPFRGDNHFIGGDLVRNATVFFYINAAYRLHIGTLAFYHRNCIFNYTPNGCKGQPIFGTVVHKSFLPFGITHITRDIVNFSILIPCGSFTHIFFINGGNRSSSAMWMKRGNGNTRLKLRHGNHFSIHTCTKCTGDGIQRFQNLHILNAQFLIGLFCGKGVEIACFRIYKSCGLVPGNFELLLNGIRDFLGAVTTKKALNQFFLKAVNQFLFLEPNTVTKGSPVRCPRL